MVELQKLEVALRVCVQQFSRIGHQESVDVFLHICSRMLGIDAYINEYIVTYGIAPHLEWYAPRPQSYTKQNSRVTHHREKSLRRRRVFKMDDTVVFFEGVQLVR